MGLWNWLMRLRRPPAPRPGVSLPPLPPADAAEYEAWREANRRPYWLPLTCEGQFDNHPNHFGGVPSLAPDETWPCCQYCGTRMALLLQLDAATLPAGAPVQAEVGQGLVQLFGCLDCGTQSEDGSAVARLLPPRERPVAAMAFDTSLLPPRSIVGWQAGSQRPGGGEWDDTRGLPLDDDPDDAVLRKGRGVDMLGGWPSWVQYAEYPECPTCQRPMRLLFQIASEEGLDFMFGDVGTAYLLYCSQHTDQLYFSWQCT